jgi:preprotein translocase subunit YajC
VTAAPYIVIVVLLGLFVAISLRNRRRQIAEDIVRTSRIGVGTEVMTTSGLYGTVVSRNDDGTVVLAIAPGVEVKWALAALRDADALSETYRRAIDGDEAQLDSAASDERAQIDGAARPLDAAVEESQEARRDDAR